jgi:hypothetical protein
VGTAVVDGAYLALVVDDEDGAAVDANDAAALVAEFVERTDLVGVCRRTRTHHPR